VLVLVELVVVLVLEDVVAGVLLAAVAPLDGAVTTPGAAELPPQPASATATETAASVIGVVLCIRGGRVASASLSHADQRLRVDEAVTASLRGDPLQHVG
jgi:hypothetical protein